MNNIFYKKIWFIAIWFTAFWMVYGGFVFVKNLLIKDVFDMQPIYLLIGMSLLFFSSRNEYRKVKKNE